jgi:hypothetical protein
VSEGTRTPDRLDHNQELYQLSYAHQASGSLAVDYPVDSGGCHSKTAIRQPVSVRELCVVPGS